MGLFGLFKSANERQLEKIEKIALQVEALAEEFEAKSDDELKQMTEILRQRLKDGATTDDILPLAFATVREASARVLKMRHFHVQIMGGIILHQGRIAEMKTGEGKTLVATLPTYLNALTGDGVHVVTVNEYLAQRDAEWMGKVHRFLGLTVSVNLHSMTVEQKREAYKADVMYSTNSELGFDYLRDNMVTSKEKRVQRPLAFAIIDEVDSILIDEARTPLIISGPGTKSSALYVEANRFAKTLAHDDVEISEKDKAVRLTESGVEKAERYFRIDNLADIENSEINNHVTMAIRARFIMKRDSDYIVKGNEIVIIDEFTGRQMIGRRYSEGLHQAIEAKENITVRAENRTLATITIQNYFRMYRKLSGMTGTAKTEEEEFKTIYSLDVVELPTNRPLQRVDDNDRIYTTIPGKLNAVVADIAETHAKGQPVLVGTVSVEKSEELSKILAKKRIPHVVLNAKNHEQEADIVAQAGKKGAVTIATNMAGRGTDIVLGGNPEHLAKQKMEREGFTHELIDVASAPFVTGRETEEQLAGRARFAELFAEFKQKTDAEKAEVAGLGGLRIIGTERHESRRIDNQLRGRAGRQGDPGSTVFYIAMEDPLVRIFAGDRWTMVASTFNFSDTEEISGKMITKVIENAQRKIEGRNFTYRKHVLSYDDVMNRQRDIIYGERNKVLEGIDIREEIKGMISGAVVDVLNESIDFDRPVDEWELDRINREISSRLYEPGEEVITEELLDSCTESQLIDTLIAKAEQRYDQRIASAEELGFDFDSLERAAFLRVLDTRWMAHIDEMDQLRKGIGLRAYGQQDPVHSYKQEGLEMFEKMEELIRRDTVVHCLQYPFEKILAMRNEEVKMATNAGQSSAPKTVKNTDKKVGRNDDCPCGSGKKYKNCCGKNQ